MKDIKRYILTIEYNADTEEIEYIQEEMVEHEDESREYCNIDLNEYFDEETLEMIYGDNTIGIS